QWQKNGNNVGVNNAVYVDASLNNNDSVWCVLTSNSACATNGTAFSNKIRMTVATLPIVLPISNNLGLNIATATICSLGTTVRYYNATPYGVWSSDNMSVASISGNGTVTPNSNGTANITYTVTNTSGCKSSSSLALTIAQPAVPLAIIGLSKVCAGSSITLSNSTPNGVWSTNQTSQATVNASTGVVLGKSAGTATINYTVTSAVGCSAIVSKAITVTSIPSVPLIAYAPGTVLTGSGSPFYGAPSGSFCTNKTFTVVGNPTGGVWSKTGVISVTTPGGVVTTGNITGAGTLKYTYTDANGCSNSRTMSGNVVSCAARGIVDNGQLVTTNDFIMYPNPTHSQFTIYQSQLIGTGTIVITDLYGKQIKTQSLSMGSNTI
ncbi:MAG: Ig-like domain-containing protein, partial [Chitinophagaceae bacterium]